MTRPFEQRLQDATTPEERAALVAKRLLGEPLSMQEQLAEIQRRMNEIGLMPGGHQRSTKAPLACLAETPRFWKEFSKALGL